MKIQYLPSTLLFILCLMWLACDSQPKANNPTTETTAESTQTETQMQEPKRENIEDGGNKQDTRSKEKSSVFPEHSGLERPLQENKTKCTFNQDCPTQMRCECDEKTGCFCMFGNRGKGKSGIDTCKNGNDCETALCIEGNGGKYYCSGSCQSDKDCQQELPLCSNISFLGKVCIRKRN